MDWAHRVPKSCVTLLSAIPLGGPAQRSSALGLFAVNLGR